MRLYATGCLLVAATDETFASAPVTGSVRLESNAVRSAPEDDVGVRLLPQPGAARVGEPFDLTIAAYLEEAGSQIEFPHGRVASLTARGLTAGPNWGGCVTEGPSSSASK